MGQVLLQKCEPSLCGEGIATHIDWVSVICYRGTANTATHQDNSLLTRQMEIDIQLTLLSCYWGHCC